MVNRKVFHFAGSRGFVDLKTELLAGVVSYFTIVYIIVVNALILSEAGIPLEAGMIATILASFLGCLIMGLWANTPIIVVPGMGVNALFTYTIVQTMGLTWQEALAAVFISGIIFMIAAFTPLSTHLIKAIPHNLKDAITVGVGLFLTLIGLEKGGIVVKGANSIISLGDFSDPFVLSTLFTLLLALILFIRNIPANFFISILGGTVIAWLFGEIKVSNQHQSHLSIEEYLHVFGALSFDGIISISFWMATFSIVMVLLFENIGLIHTHVKALNEPEKFNRSFQANAISTIFCGLVGTSPTVSTVETAAGIATGGKTGVTALTTGILFLLSFFMIPLIKLVPGSAIAPILIIIGALMLQNIKTIDLDDISEWIPAFLIITIIPFTYSIVDGIGFGFIVYPILKVIVGKGKEVSLTLYIIALLFLVNFIPH